MKFLVGRREYCRDLGAMTVPVIYVKNENSKGEVAKVELECDV